MSILFRGMEMPKSCGFCPFENHTDDGYECRINGCLTEYQKRPSDCPLVPVPAHGDLIDRDDFFAACPELVDGYKRITDDIVVIPAEEGGCGRCDHCRIPQTGTCRYAEEGE